MDAETRETFGSWVAGFEYAMLTTRAGDGALDSRPVQILQVDDDCAIWLFTNAASEKVAAIAADPHVNLAFVGAAKKIFVSVSGMAETVHDARKIDELWTAAQTVFFPQGRDDPALVLVRIMPISARYWNGNEPVLGLLLKFGKALLRGEPSDLGTSARVDFDRGD